MLIQRQACIYLLLTGMLVSLAPAQQPPAGTPQPSAGAQQQQPGADQLRPNYILGPNDQILVRAFEVEELNEKPFRIDAEGVINFPLIGKVKAQGLSVQELEAEMVRLLRVYVVKPQVIINITQFRTDPVWFIGAFKVPSIYSLQGRRTLVEMLTSIGGLQPNATRRIKLTRRREYGTIPLPTAVVDDAGNSTVEISMGSLQENINPAEDIVLQPYDQITVERAEQIYVYGEVLKVGPFELGERDSISVLQLLSMAGGVSREADTEKVRILRPVLNTSRRAEIMLDLKKVMTGKANDYPLLPNDVLIVPRNGSRVVWTRVGLFALPLIPTLILLVIR